ncbi:MAG TPA: hypothetical protein VLO09_06415, partial [Ornithinimicrobium sp.]|nr:hypothetical protein [Ornithinimicrobium sp.]
AQQESAPASTGGGDAGADAAGSGPSAAAAHGGRGRSGGQDITRGLITAKKAELARVKNDDVVADGRPARKKGPDKNKDKEKDPTVAKDKPTKARKGKKSKKSKKEKKPKGS